MSSNRAINRTYNSYTEYAHNSEYPQAWNLAYSYMCALNSPYFETEGGNFSIKNMSNKGEGLSKDGTGRVAVYNQFGCIHSYTLECNYNSINPNSTSIKTRWNGGKVEK